MDALRAAVPLARLLLSVACERRSGVLRLQVGCRWAELQLVAGAATALSGVDGELLGDTLLRKGGLDTLRHAAALAEAEPWGLVGQWLVAVGAASQQAVDRALVEQLERRVASLLPFGRAGVRFDACPAHTNVDAGVRVALAPAVFAGLLALAEGLTDRELRQLAGTNRLRLTRAGTHFTRVLGAVGRAPEVEAVLAGGHDQQPRRAVLRALGFAADGRLDADACTLLLRKQREIRRQVSAEALLDLPPRAAPEQARRALRRLAQKLHPDRFSGELPALRAVSNEVMRALSHAELTLRSAPQAAG